MLRLALSAAFLFVASLPLTAQPVGDIEFFGYQGLDLEKVRATLPLHEGDALKQRKVVKKNISAAVAGVIGKDPTDIGMVCCGNGKTLVYIGLPGASNKSFSYNPAPTGKQRLPPDVLKLDEELGKAMQKAVRAGGDWASEDDSKGYALFKYPAAQAVQLKFRAWAIAHEKEVFEVSRSSSFTEDRRLAVELLGYANQSPSQIEALIYASRDPDDEVRNNATRALGVLARAKSPLTKQISPEPFIAMLNSSTWTDRNKGSILLMELTEPRDPALLAKLRTEALPSLIEMALWRESGHAGASRVILGRVAGIPEDRLLQLAWFGDYKEIIKAAQ